MNYIDIILGLILVFSIYQGFTKGLIVMGGTLLALVGGVWGAVNFSDYAQSIMVNNFGWDFKYNSLLAFVLLFIVIVIFVNLFARILKKLADAVALGVIDKILGIVFAIAKNAFIISILLVVLNGIDRTFSFMPHQKMKNSYLYSSVERFAPALFPYLDFDTLKDSVSAISTEQGK